MKNAILQILEESGQGSNKVAAWPGPGQRLERGQAATPPGPRLRRSLHGLAWPGLAWPNHQLDAEGRHPQYIYSYVDRCFELLGSKNNPGRLVVEDYIIISAKMCMYISDVSLMCPVRNIITKDKQEFLFWFGRFGGEPCVAIVSVEGRGL